MTTNSNPNTNQKAPAPAGRPAFAPRPAGPGGRPAFAPRPGFGPRPAGVGAPAGRPGFGPRPGGFGQRPGGPGARPGFGPRPGGPGGPGRGPGGFGRGPGGPGGRKPFVKRVSEFKERVLEVRRVTRVVAGGKRFSFRATVVVGDMKGRVGLGTAKGLDFAASVQKATHQAEKAVVRVHLSDGRTVPHELEAKMGAAKVRIKPAKKGHGLIAGGSLRTVLELAGVKDVSAKILGTTKNKIANARAGIKALTMAQPK